MKDGPDPGLAGISHSTHSERCGSIGNFGECRFIRNFQISIGWSIWSILMNIFVWEVRIGHLTRFLRAYSNLSSRIFCSPRFDDEMSNIAIFENPEIHDLGDISHLWAASRNFW